MTPQKIIFYTRRSEVHLHMEMARQFAKKFPGARFLFVSFFSQALKYAEAAGFETLYAPVALRATHDDLIDGKRVAEIDAFCQREFLGLNAMLNTERFLPAGREKAKLFLYEHLTMLDQIVEERTLGISSMYDHFVYLAAAMLAFEKAGAHFAFVGCGVPAGRVIALRTPAKTWINPRSKEKEEELLKTAQEEVNQPSEERISYMQSNKLDKPLTLRERINRAQANARYGRIDKSEGSYFPTGQKNWVVNAFAWRYLKWRNQKHLPRWDIKVEEDLSSIEGYCVFLALHMEPEATILMYSPQWRDQIEICRLVSEALPLGVTLLVKENPKMLFKRPPGYYETLQRYSNVKLVSTSVNSAALINRSEAVVSLAGTVTVEARLKGKYAFCFGKPPFYRLATARGAKLLENLRTVLNEKNKDSKLDQDFMIGWKQWIQGTFIASSGNTVYRSDLGRFCFDYSNKNAAAHVNTIIGCLGIDSTKDNVASGVSK